MRAEQGKGHGDFKIREIEHFWDDVVEAARRNCECPYPDPIKSMSVCVLPEDDSGDAL
jgi:hypothetical protein